MDQDDLNALIRDANALTLYAARAGKLPPASNVFGLAEALSANPPPPDRSAKIAQLCAEVDALRRAVAPVRLWTLVWKDRLAHKFRLLAANASPFVVGALSLALTMYLAFQSSQLHQADTALREYQEWIAQQPKDKLYSAFKMYHYERVLTVAEPPLAQLDAYQRLVEDAHHLANKGAAIQELLQHASQLLHVPPFLTTIAGEAADDPAIKGLPPSEYTIVPPNEAASGRSLKDAGTTNPGQPPAHLDHVLRPMSTQINCKPDPLAAKPIKAALKTRPPVDIDSYASGWHCFLERIQIDEKRLSYSPWPVIYDTRLKINLLVTWLLPGLYGMLGACVFLMRDLVVTSNESRRREPSVLKELALLLRIALGGLAGIIIGWFWVPAAGGSGTALPAISSIPFGIAFLAGFSIDMLFSMLDRLNKTVDNRNTQSGSGSQQR